MAAPNSNITPQLVLLFISLHSINPNDRYKKTPLSATIPRPTIGLKKIHPKKTKKKITIASY